MGDPELLASSWLMTAYYSCTLPSFVLSALLTLTRPMSRRSSARPPRVHQSFPYVLLTSSESPPLIDTLSCRFSRTRLPLTLHLHQCRSVVGEGP